MVVVVVVVVAAAVNVVGFGIDGVAGLLLL